MRSARHREWRFGAENALRKDPALEDKFVALDKLITDAKAQLAAANVPEDLKAFALLEAYGDVVRELLMGGALGTPIGAYPHVLRGLLRHRKEIP